MADVARPTPHAAATATVRRVERGTVVVDGGRQAGIGPDTWLRFVGPREVETPRLDSGGTEVRTMDRIVATSRVRVLDGDRALVDLNRGDRVREGVRAEVWAWSEPSTAPPQLGGTRPWTAPVTCGKDGATPTVPR